MAAVLPACVFADFNFAAWAGSPWGITILVVAAFFLLAWLFPYHFFRCLLWVIGRTLYRVRTIGREHVPRTGGELHRLAAAPGGPAPLHPLRRVRRLHPRLGHPPVPAVGTRHPRRRQRRAARHRQVVARRLRRPGPRRVGLHLRGGPADAHRLDAPLRPRLRTNRQTHQGADHPRLPRPGLGQRFQLVRRQRLLEDAAGATVPRDRGLRHAARARVAGRRRAPGRAEAVGRLRRRPHGGAQARSPAFCARGRAPPVSLLHHRQQHERAGTQLRQGARRGNVPGECVEADPGR